MDYLFCFVWLLPGRKRGASEPLLCSGERVTAGSGPSGARPGLRVVHVLHHVPPATVARSGHVLQREGGLVWVALPVARRRLPGVSGGSAGPNGPTEPQVSASLFFVFFVVSVWNRWTSSPLCLLFRGLRRTSRPSPYWWCHWLLWLLFPWKHPPPLWPTFQAALPPLTLLYLSLPPVTLYTTLPSLCPTGEEGRDTAGVVGGRFCRQEAGGCRQEAEAAKRQAGRLKES